MKPSLLLSLLSRYSTAKTQNKGRASSSIGGQQSGRQRKVRKIVASPRREQVQDLINNTKLSEGYLTLARDIEVMEPKSPEDIYKAHPLDGRASRKCFGVESARQNLAATFVNAFVNAGFGQDKLMIVASESAPRNWLMKNKDHGKTSTVASLDVDSELAQIDKHLHHTDSHVIAGALLGSVTGK
ncbi:26S proteasome non-ATPase regulatory subunit 2 A [Dionaea muscipula]